MSRVEETLQMLGMDYEAASGEYRASCPGHKRLTGHEDQNPSWYINDESGLHICFSCGFKGNLASLVSEVRGIDLAQAQALLVDSRTDLDASAIRRRLTDATVWRKPFVKEHYLPESSLARFGDPPSWALAERRIQADTAQQYQVMWEDTTGSWILPIRHPHVHRLLGWQIKGQVKRSFVRNRPTGVQKSGCLFGLHLLSEDQKVWVVESPLDAVRLYGLGYPAVATFGSRVSKTQMRLLSAFDRLVLAFDNDDAGAVATDQFLHAARPMGLDILVATFPRDCKDPGDCTDEQLRSLTLKSMVRR